MTSGTKCLIGLALALAAAVGALPARAADCAKATTQTDLSLCVAQGLAGADEALNAAYGALVKQPSLADRLDRLRAAERAWVAFRDAQCAFEGARYEGGSLQPMTVSTCARALTERRTAELKAALACERDDSKC